MHSAIYRGWLRHRRFAPLPHAFRYRLFIVCISISPSSTACSRDAGCGRRAGAAIRALRPRAITWAILRCRSTSARARSCRGAHRPAPGRADPAAHASALLRLLLQPGQLLLLLRRCDARVETIVAEVTNTPWGERHCYVLGEPRRVGRGRMPDAIALRRRCTSRRSCRWTLTTSGAFSPPGGRLAVHMALQAAGGDQMFDATMQLASARADRTLALAAHVASLSAHDAAKSSPPSTGRRCGCGSSACRFTSTRPRPQRPRHPSPGHERPTDERPASPTA